MKKAKKFLAWLLTAVIVSSSLPLSVFADEANQPSAVAEDTSGWGALRKEGAPGRLLYLSLISSWKRCNHCGYAVFSLLRSARCCWKASSISSGINSWSMPTPL